MGRTIDMNGMIIETGSYVIVYDLIGNPGSDIVAVGKIKDIKLECNFHVIILEGLNTSFNRRQCVTIYPHHAELLMVGIEARKKVPEKADPPSFDDWMTGKYETGSLKNVNFSSRYTQEQLFHMKLSFNKGIVITRLGLGLEVNRKAIVYDLDFLIQWAYDMGCLFQERYDKINNFDKRVV